MTWTTYHSRGAVLRAVIDTANERHDGLLPLDVDGVSDTFESELALLGALQLKWHTRLTGHIERALLSQPLALDEAVVAAWANAADELPGVRAIIDHYRAAPVDEGMAAAVRKAALKEQSFLAAMAGLGSVGDLAAAPRGAELEDRARERHLLDATDAEGPEGRVTRLDGARPSFLERLRAVLAA